MALPLIAIKNIDTFTITYPIPLHNYDKILSNQKKSNKVENKPHKNEKNNIRKNKEIK